MKKEKLTQNDKEMLITILKDYAKRNFKRLGTCDLIWVEDFIKKLKPVEEYQNLYL